jgi:hypothetical protein
MIDTGDVLSGLATGIPQGAGIGLAFLIVKWFADFVAKRIDRKEDRLDSATQRFIGQLTGQVETLLVRCSQIEEHHAHCLEELASLRGYVDGMGDARNDSAAIVARDRVADRRKDRE